MLILQWPVRVAGHPVLDKVDVRILRELTQAHSFFPARPGLKGSFRDIAKKLGLKPGTARNRINAMRDSGVLTGVSVYANPSILGLESGAYALEVPRFRVKEDVVQHLKLVEGVTFIQNFHGPLIGISFVYEDDAALRKKLALIRSIVGAEAGLFSRVTYPPCTAKLGRRDWQFIARVTKGEVTTFAELAKELRTSVRTLRRRMARVFGGWAVFSVPTMDYRAIQGGVPADAVVTFMEREQRGEAEKKILRLVEDHMIYGGVWEDFGLYSMVLPRVATASALARDIRGIAGVRQASVELVDEHIDLTSSLGDYVGRKLASTGIVMPPVPASTRAKG